MKKKIIDERGFLFGKISVVDIMAVLLVIAMGLMLYARFFSGGGDGVGFTETGTVKVECVLKVTLASRWHLDTIKPGDVIYSGGDGPALGTVKDVRTEPAYTLVETPEGTVASVPVEDYYDIYITVEAQCTTGANGYYLGGSVELNRNMTLQICTVYDTMACTVYSVS